MIGYYVHHHGSGHLTRARVIAHASAEPIIALSALPEPAAHPFADWVQLAPDPALDAAADPDAGGALHWAPTNSPQYARRMRQLVDWTGAARPRLVVVDLSVEVAALVRLVGVPVVVMTLPGRREDAAHDLAFRIADRILAPWPRALLEPAHLRPFAQKTVYTGALSRFDGLPLTSPASGRLVVLLGAGGGDVGPEQVERAAASVGWQGVRLGGGSWTADVHRELCAASVVVTHAGTNSLAEIAATRRPAVVIPQSRPFDEQRCSAAALAAHGVTTVRPHWPTDAEWPAVVAEATALGGAGWARWSDGRGAHRAAAALGASTAERCA